MSDETLYALAYNAHEAAESAALDAMWAKLREQPIEALACLCDPDWNWETRSWMSAAIIDAADEVLNEKLDAAVGFEVSAMA